MQVRSVTSSGFQVDSETFNGVQGYNVTLTNTPPFVPRTTAITPPADIVMSGGAGPGEPQGLGATQVQGGGKSGLGGWKV